jgi:hypothetical protein
VAVRAFLSFVEEDLTYVNLFRAQAKNEYSNLEFDDYSVKEPINSYNSDYIKQQITAKIKYATLTVCLYGPTTHSSPWVNWELNKTLEMGKPIMGVWLYDDGRIQYYPGPLQNWPRVGWEHNKIMTAMNSLITK